MSDKRAKLKQALSNTFQLVCPMVPAIILSTFQSSFVMTYKCRLGGDEPTYKTTMPITFPYSFHEESPLGKPCGCDLPDASIASIAVVVVGVVSMMWLLVSFTLAWMEFEFLKKSVFRFVRFVIATFLMMGWLGGSVAWGVGIWNMTSMAVTGFQVSTGCEARFFVLEAGSEKNFFTLYLALAVSTINIFIWATKSWTAFEESLKAAAEEIRRQLAEEEAAQPRNNLVRVKY